MDFKKLTQGERIVVVTGALLVIDLLLLPWHHYGLGTLGERFGVPIGFDRRGVQTPGSFWGIVAFLLAAAMVAQILLARFSTVTLPKIPVPWGQAHLIAGGVILGVLVLKLLTDYEFLAFGAWLGVVLAGLLAYGGYLVHREAAAGGLPPPA